MLTNPLKNFRNDHGLTQRDLGLLLGLDADVAQSRVSHYESERREIPKDIAWAFLEVAEDHGDSYVLEDLYPRPLKAG